MKYYISQFFEQLFPVVFFFFKKRKINNKIKSEGNNDKLIEEYEVLDVDVLMKRMKEEHERAIKIDEKTSKFILGLSISLTIIAAASGSFAKLLLDVEYTNIVAITCSVSALYMLSAGIIALGAFQTLPLFGYGTKHEIYLKNNGKKYLATALINQEKINTVRHLRNEAAYQSLRNGFLILFTALVFLIVILVKSEAVNNDKTLSKPLVESNTKAIIEKKCN